MTTNISAPRGQKIIPKVHNVESINNSYRIKEIVDLPTTKWSQQIKKIAP
jgi:hypothetical protein